MIQITDHLRRIRNRVTHALTEAGRPLDSVRIVAISKRQPVDKIKALYEAGQRDFGESYVQEAHQKQLALRDYQIIWHFIGKIQRNKTRQIAEGFDWVHSLDRIDIARRLSRQRPAGSSPLNTLIQVSHSHEPQRSGTPASDVADLAKLMNDCENLRLRGLMAMPPAASSPEAAGRIFAETARLAEQLRLEGFAVDTLSMGMSADFEIAIAHGANCVRIGTALFGPRPE